MKWYSLGRIEAFPVRTGRLVHISSKEIAVFRLSSGEIKAVENRCPHKGGPLVEGMISGEYVFCPLHDMKINLNDGLVQKPDTGCIRTYTVELRGEEIVLGLPLEELAAN